MLTVLLWFFTFGVQFGVLMLFSLRQHGGLVLLLLDLSDWSWALNLLTCYTSCSCCRLPCELAPVSWCRNLAGAALRHLAALIAGVLSRARRLWPSSWFRSTACTILLRQLKRSAIAAAVNCRPTGLHPAAPLLSALAYHVSPCFNLLYSTFYIFF